MKKKKFYSHLVKTDNLKLALQSLDLDDKEYKHVEMLIESTIHHEIIDAILSELSEEDKKIFLKHLASDNNEKVWEYLMTKVDSVEEKIKKSAESLKKELYKDIEKSKK